MTEAQPVEKKRSRRIYICWGVALALLLGLGLFCWLVVPLWRTDKLLTGLRESDSANVDLGGAPKEEYLRVIEALGGPERAAQRVRTYIRLPDKIASNKSMGVRLLRHCGPPAVPVLIEIADSPGSGQQLLAIGVLHNMVSDHLDNQLEGNTPLHPSLFPAVSAFERALGHPDPEVREAAARSLSICGEYAFKAIPALERASKDDEERVRAEAAIALEMVKEAVGKDK